jgi:hypothetical protein
MLINTKIALSAVMILTAATSATLANDLGTMHKKPRGLNSYGNVVEGVLSPGWTSWSERNVATYPDSPASSCPALEGYPDCHPQ